MDAIGQHQTIVCTTVTFQFNSLITLYECFRAVTIRFRKRKKMSKQINCIHSNTTSKTRKTNNVVNERLTSNWTIGFWTWEPLHNFYDKITFLIPILRCNIVILVSRTSIEPTVNSTAILKYEKSTHTTVDKITLPRLNSTEFNYGYSNSR